MRLVAIGMVKDEADVIERVLVNVAAQGADRIVLLDNESSDDTRGIINRLGGSIGETAIDVYTDWEVGYYQSAKMTGLARHAGELGADWVWPFDADEVWTWPAGRVRDALEATDARVVAGDMFNHYETSLDEEDGHPFDTMNWRSKTALGLPKIIARYSPGLVIEPGNHAAGGALAGAPVAELGVRVHHYPYRGAEHFIRKARNGARAYAATDLPPWTGQHWREYGETLELHGEAGLREWYRAAFYYDDPLAPGEGREPLVLDPAGWPDTIPAAYDRGES